MIGQYLSNKNESATVAKSEIFSKLNKADVSVLGTDSRCINIDHEDYE